MPLAEVTKGFDSLHGKASHGGVRDKMSADVVLLHHRSKANSCAVQLASPLGSRVATDVHEGDLLILEWRVRDRILRSEQYDSTHHTTLIGE